MMTPMMKALASRCSLRSVSAAFLALWLTAPSSAQPTQASLNAEINSKLPTNNSDLITAATLRQVLTDITAGIFTQAPAVGGVAYPVAPYVTGDILYASAPNVMSRLADVAVGNVLISGGVGVPPAYAPIGVAIPGLLAGNNTWSGAQHFSNGIPWVDVTSSGITGCPAVADSVTDNTTCIQNAINTLEANYYSGTVFIPYKPGFYCIKGGITLHNIGVVLTTNSQSTVIAACGADVTLVTMAGGHQRMENFLVVAKGDYGDPGEISFGANNPAILMTNGCGYCVLSNIESDGGTGVVDNGNSGFLDHLGVFFSYGPSLLHLTNSTWVSHALLDHGSPPLSACIACQSSIPARVASQSYPTVGTPVTYNDGAHNWYITSMVAGAAGAGATVSMANLYQPILDGGTQTATNGSTAAGSNVLHFSSVPGAATVGAGIVDVSNTLAIPSVATATTVTATGAGCAGAGTVCMSANASLQVNSGDSIYFGFYWSLVSQVGSTSLWIDGVSETYITMMDLSGTTDYALLMNNGSNTLQCTHCLPSGHITGNMVLSGGAGAVWLIDNNFGYSRMQGNAGVQAASTFAGDLAIQGGTISSDVPVLIQGGNDFRVNGVEMQSSNGNADVAFFGSPSRFAITGNSMITTGTSCVLFNAGSSADYGAVAGNACNGKAVTNNGSGSHIYAPGMVGAGPGSSANANP